MKLEVNKAVILEEMAVHRNHPELNKMLVKQKPIIQQNRNDVAAGIKQQRGFRDSLRLDAISPKKDGYTKMTGATRRETNQVANEWDNDARMSSSKGHVGYARHSSKNLRDITAEKRPFKHQSMGADYDITSRLAPRIAQSARQ